MADQSLVEQLLSNVDELPITIAKIMDDQNSAIAELQGNTVTDAELASAISTHDADVGAHATQIGDAVDAGITAHVAASDPHTQYQKESEKGLANGYAPLDNGGKIPSAHLPNSVMQYQGQYNPNTNTPALADGIGDAGDVYEIQVAGSHDFGSGAISFNMGDWVVYNGSVWQKSINSNEVVSVNGLTGAVSLTADNIPEALIPTNLYFTDARARAAVVDDAIVDGVTNKAPSQNAVFDALALKASDSLVVHLAGTETITGYKTFQAGLKSQEEILISSTANAYASVRSINAAGDTQEVRVGSGDSASGNSGDTIIGVGSAVATAPPALVVQGLTITQLSAFYGLGKLTGNVWVQIVVDNANITNPAAPTFFLRGGGNQRLVITVNSATTVNDVVAAFPSSGNPAFAFTITGSAVTTFVNDLQQFTAGNDVGQVVLVSSYRARVNAQLMTVGQDVSGNGFAFQGVTQSGASDSDNIFLLSGRVTGSGSSGGISIRSADMESSGGSGGTFVRTGSVNGAIQSGNTTISTGATTTYATANSGTLNLTTGIIGGLSGNSGPINMNSGNINSGSGTSGAITVNSGNNNLSGQVGGTGNMTLRSGDMSGTNSGGTGVVTLRSGNKTNAGATGATGALIVQSGNNSGTGNSGNTTVSTGNVVGAAATSGNLILATGSVTTGTKGVIQPQANIVPNVVNSINLGAPSLYFATTYSNRFQVTATGSIGDSSNFWSMIFSGTTPKGNAYTFALNTTSGGTGRSIALYTGGGTTQSGHLFFETGDASAGNSGDIVFQTGTATGAKGKIKLNSLLNLITQGAPGTPANGDMWFDGTDLIMYIGGASYKFTKTLV